MFPALAPTNPNPDPTPTHNPNPTQPQPNPNPPNPQPLPRFHLLIPFHAPQTLTALKAATVEISGRVRAQNKRTMSRDQEFPYPPVDSLIIPTTVKSYSIFWHSISMHLSTVTLTLPLYIFRKPKLNLSKPCGKAKTNTKSEPYYTQGRHKIKLILGMLV